MSFCETFHFKVEMKCYAGNICCQILGSWLLTLLFDLDEYTLKNSLFLLLHLAFGL